MIWKNKQNFNTEILIVNQSIFTFSKRFTFSQFTLIRKYSHIHLLISGIELCTYQRFVTYVLSCLLKQLINNH